jgi:FkbM family methyltransferase
LSLISSGEHLIAGAFRACGFRLFRRKRLQYALDRRERLIRSHNIDLVLDVGANIGQYVRILREFGYHGRVSSFEPMRNALDQLTLAAAKDKNWQVFPFALGDSEEMLELNISENSISSSVLPMLPTHEKFSPLSHFIATESIHVRRLDDVFPELRKDAKHIWLKIDVQGFEDRVLSGACESMSSIQFIQIELSLRPLYKNQISYLEILGNLSSQGFELIGLEPGFMDIETGELLQVDGIFRNGSINAEIN